MCVHTYILLVDFGSVENTDRYFNVPGHELPIDSGWAMEISNIPDTEGNLDTTSVIFHCRDKIPNKSKLMKGGLTLTHDLRVQPIVVGKAWQQKHNKDGHIASTLRKQRDGCWSSV